MNEQVFGLDVSMDHVLAMAVFDGLEQLIDVLADQHLIDTVRVLLEDLEQVLLEVLKDQIQAVAPKQENQSESDEFKKQYCHRCEISTSMKDRK